MYVLLDADQYVNGKKHLAGEVIQIDDDIDQEFGTVLTEDGDSPQTAAEWADDNPTLTLNNFGVESDTGKIKVGDGTTAWNDLEYAVGTFAAPAETLGDKVSENLIVYPEQADGEGIGNVDWNESKLFIRIVTTDEVPVTTFKCISLSTLAQLITAIQND